MSHAHVYTAKGSLFVCDCGQRAVFDPVKKIWIEVK